MEKNRFIKTALCLVLAFAMTFVPIFSSYAMIATALVVNEGEVTEEAAPADNVDEAGGDEAAPADNVDEAGGDEAAPEEDSAPAEETAEDTSSDAAQAEEEEDSPEQAAPEQPSANNGDVTVQEPEEEQEEAEDAEEATKTVYEWKDKKVKVTAKLSDASIIPDDAELVVKMIDKNSKDYNYDAYMEALNKDSQSKHDEKNTLLYDIAFIKDGVELQPESGKVSVSFEFLDNQLAESIGAKKAADVNVIHLPLTDEVKEKYDTTADAKNIKAKDIDVEAITAEDNNLKVSVKNEKVVFKTDNFSVFAYTVDFEYNGYQFSMPGGTTIELSKIFEQLNINRNVKDVKNVTFTKPELVEVKEPSLFNSEWRLESKKAFSTKEKLTVEMNDGETIEINVTDSADALEVSISLYDYSDTNQLNFPSEFGEEDHIYAFAWVGPSSVIADAPDNTPWAAVDISDIKGNSGTYNVSFNSFNTTQWGGQEVSYSDLTDKNSLRVRVVHSSKSLNELKLGNLKQMANGSQQQKDEYDELWNGGFEGYSISTNHNSGLNVDAGTYEVGFKQGNKHELDVVLTFDPATDKGPITAGKSYILLEATSADGNNKYYYVVEAVTDGSEDVVYLPIRGNWSSGQKFSSHWTNLNASVISPKPEKTIQTGGVKPNEADYTEGYLIGDYKYTYEGHVDHDVDEVNHIDREEFKFKLSSATYEDAKKPSDTLGNDGVEFGIIADSYNQHGHTETNFAVKNYGAYDNTNIDIDGSGDNPMPFYAGSVTNGQLWISDKTKCAVDLYITKEDDDAGKIHITAPSVEKIYESQSDINNYVQSLINEATANSLAYSTKTTVTPTNYSTNNKVINTTQFPDNTTIYVDCTNVDLSLNGWELHKKPGQTIIFNIPDSGTTTISKFYVVTYDEDGNAKTHTWNDKDGNEKSITKIDTNTAALDGDPEYNKLVDKEILEHVVFNAYNASELDLSSGPAGMFLAPNATKVKQTDGSGAGWIMTNGEVESHGEWHFYRHERHYTAKGDFTLEAEKELKNGESTVPIGDRKFSFALYSIDENGVVSEKAIETKQTDSYGKVYFTKLKFTEHDIPDGTTKTYKYVIKEIVPPESERLPGVNYTAEDIYIEVDATDTHTEGSDTGIITFKIYEVKNGERIREITPESQSTEDAIYDVGSLINTVEDQKGSLKIRKSVTENHLSPSENAKSKLAGTYSFAIYSDADCTIPVKNGEDPITISLTINDNGDPVISDEVTGLTPGDYWIKETSGAGVDEDVHPVKNPVHVKVEAGKTGDEAVVATFVNNINTGEYNATTSYSGEKIWSNDDPTKRPESINIVLKANGTVVEGVEPVWTYANNKWTFTFNDLPVFDNDGNVISYSVDEPSLPEGYSCTAVPTATSYELDTEHPDVNEIDPCDVLSFDLSNTYDLGFVIIQCTGHFDEKFVIWTQRNITNDEKSALNTLAGNVFHNFDAAECLYLSGVPMNYRDGVITATATTHT